MAEKEDNNRAGLVGMTGVTRTRKEEAGSWQAIMTAISPER